jgi:hypothetical protein
VILTIGIIRHGFTQPLEMSISTTDVAALISKRDFVAEVPCPDQRDAKIPPVPAQGIN